MRPKGTAKELEEVRIRATDLLDMGVPQKDIATKLGVNASTVSKWAKIYKAQGTEGLKARKNRGRPRKLSNAQLRFIRRWQLRGPTAFFRQYISRDRPAPKRWTFAMKRKVIYQVLLNTTPTVTYSPNGIRAIWEFCERRYQPTNPHWGR